VDDPLHDIGVWHTAAPSTEAGIREAIAESEDKIAYKGESEGSWSCHQHGEAEKPQDGSEDSDASSPEAQVKVFDAANCDQIPDQAGREDESCWSILQVIVLFDLSPSSASKCLTSRCTCGSHKSFRGPPPK
jgi:hypothetical protein